VLHSYTENVKPLLMMFDVVVCLNVVAINADPSDTVRMKSLLRQ
jgi:hypothetical protein